MSYKLFISATLMFVLVSSASYGKDFSNPHTFKPGDTISADVVNEIYDYITQSKKTITELDIIGTWNCTSVLSSFFTAFTFNGATTDDDGIVFWRTDTVTFTDDGDGTYSFATSNYDLFYLGDDRMTNYSLNGSFIIKNSIIYQKVVSSGYGDISSEVGRIVSLDLTNLSETRIKFVALSGGNVSSYGGVVLCDKQSLPPDAPTRLSAFASSTTVTLSWTDNSSDETGFKILRKDSLTGSFATITTTAADATSYADTVTSGNTYWYRVEATNSNGDSLGTNLVRVAVE